MSLHPAINEKDHAKGNLKATLEIVEYGDYQCPYCGAAYPVLNEMMKEFGSQVKFVFRNFPLSEIHPSARIAALAAEAAALQGKFWEMHDAIYNDQSHLHTKDLLQRATSLGLDMDKFANDLEEEDLANRIDADFESGIRSGVNGTPSFFINGKKFDGGADNLLQLLRESTETN
ncbi:DsbA family protein [Ferruginibacter albus]|uniref:DsbA family protein n=1 Tax=Ferruginibacter albus TaxID=2875540 RepID=UPI001CC3B555|nr:thioredoxin domain-containing protein [Ferruginibacter albus]UAY50947.1 DsbA family protein [Ferruginibacter albus]